MKRTLAVLSLLFVLIVSASAQSGAPQQKPEQLSNKQLNALIAMAETSAEHRRIAQYYEAKSQQYLAESKKHEQMLASYKQNPVFNSSKFKTSTIDHCQYLVNSLRNVSAKLHELAEEHNQMAIDAEKK